MAWLLDTNIAIHFRDGNEAIVRRVARLRPTPSLSIVTRVELESGVAADPEDATVRRGKLDDMLGVFAVLPFGNDEARTYGRIVSATGFSRTRVLDRMIAAQAIVARATLVTINGNDFQDIPGLSLEIWRD